MPEELVDLDKLLQPDGYINYYAVLGAAPDAPADALQEGINALYQEAQINRDHRVPAKRRDYQTLLEILPQARLVLLDESRRKRYNAYTNAVDMGLPRMPFTEFVTALVRERDDVDTRSDILTIRDLSKLRITSPDEAPAQSAVATPKPAPEVKAPAPKLKDTIEMAAPREKPARTEPKPEPVATPAPEESSPVSAAQKFSTGAIAGGLFVLCGLVVALPKLLAMPIILAAALALLCGAVVAYVFSLAGEVIEA